MAKRKRRNRNWHHRAPDFKLVYCGPKNSFAKKEAQPTHRRRRSLVSITVDGDEEVGREFERKKRLE